MLMAHPQVFIFMKEKDKTKKTLSFILMGEVIVEVKTCLQLCKIVIKGVSESMDQLKMFNHLMGMVEEFFPKIHNKIQFFTIGLKSSQFIAMEQNI